MAERSTVIGRRGIAGPAGLVEGWSSAPIRHEAVGQRLPNGILGTAGHSVRYRRNVGKLKVSRASISWIGCAAAYLHAHVGQATHVLHQHLHAALRNLRYADERGVALLPVGVSQEGGQQAGSQRGNGVPSQRQRKPVQALLPKLVQLALALALVFVRVRAVPVGLILQGAVTKSGQIQCFQQRWVIALTRQSVGYKACAALLSLLPEDFSLQEERLQLARPSQTSLILAIVAGREWIHAMKINNHIADSR